MNNVVLSEIEKSIEDLSTDEQLLLISRVAEKLRKNAEREAEFESQLGEMAADEQIQAELRSIERDFAVAEFDGLTGGRPVAAHSTRKILAVKPIDDEKRKAG